MKKIFFTIMFFFVCSCSDYIVSSDGVVPPTPDKGTGRLVLAGNFEISLESVDGKCMAKYRKSGEQAGIKTELVSDLEGPCEFMLDPSTLEPLYYTYQNGLNRRIVLVITGGPVSDLPGDKFMPNGCGTQLQKILVFSDRVEFGPAPELEDRKQKTPRCPSSGLDEVHFAV